MHAISTSVNICVCTSVEDIQVATLQDAGLPRAKFIHYTRLAMQKDKVEQTLKHYRAIRHELEIINGIAMKDKRIIPFLLTEIDIGGTAQQWHGHRKDETFSEGVSVLGEYECRHQKCYKTECYMLGVSAGTTIWEDNPIWSTIRNPGRWLVLIHFCQKKKTLLCIEDYYRKLSIVKKKRWQSYSRWPDKNSQGCFFQNLHFQWQLCQMLAWTSYHRWSDISQEEEHSTGHNIILSPKQWLGGSTHKICKAHGQRCLDTNNNVNLALLQIRSTPMSAGLPHPSTLLFNKLITGILP